MSDPGEKTVPKQRVPRPIGFALFLGLLGIGVVYATGKGGFMNNPAPQTQTPPQVDEKLLQEASSLGQATFGGGCFWCTEAVYLQLKGVSQVVSGYAGGELENPTYEQVSTGETGHAEVIQVTFDPQVVSYAEILEVFWKTHDPTTLNRQGADIGTQYRSAVFYHNDAQRQVAEFYKGKLDKAGLFSSPIVTQIDPLGTFYPAEDYHQNYFALNPRQPYCLMVVGPKVEKFREIFRDKLKPAESGQ